jgi:predicted DNA-binding protein (MmcQ/YjbR family)
MSERIAEKLRRRALELPEAYEESPWGHRVTKVKGKIFLFCDADEDGGLAISVKLPATGKGVLKESFAEPTGYGLGKAGWVSCSWPKGVKVPEDRIVGWIDESYRAVAPKKLIALLDAKPRAKAEKPAAKPKRLKARVVLLCLDPLRARRAVEALDGEGITVETSSDLEKVRARLGKLDAVIVDLGREPEPSVALVEEIDASDHRVHLFVAGVRDAKMRRRLQANAGSADLFNEPPGDPSVVGAIASALRAGR